jgi:hypothetical protein
MVSKIQELSYGVCHEKVEGQLGFHTRRLFGRLARAMAIDVIILILKSKITVRIQSGVTFSKAITSGHQ